MVLHYHIWKEDLLDHHIHIAEYVSQVPFVKKWPLIFLKFFRKFKFIINLYFSVKFSRVARLFEISNYHGWKEDYLYVVDMCALSDI